MARLNRTVLGEKTSTGVAAQPGECKRSEAIYMLKNCAQSVPKNIENYRTTSKSIEIPKAMERGCLQGKSFIFYAFASGVAPPTR